VWEITHDLVAKFSDELHLVILHPLDASEQHLLEEFRVKIGGREI